MNPSTRIWDIPPPPGTEEIQLEYSDSPSEEPPQDIKSEEKEKVLERPIDRINPYLKNPEYIEYEKQRHLDRRRKSRSRSQSRERHHRRKYSRSKSRSRDRHRRSRSRSRRRRRRYSSSRSRSRSPTYRRPKYSRKRHSSPRNSRSRSKSRSASRSRQKSHRSKSHKEKISPPSRKSSSEEKEKPQPDLDISEVDMKIEEDEEDSTKDNVFKNDGTFLEMFKKMQEQQNKVPESPVAEPLKKPLPAFGKRRGGKVLKTGMVRKLKQQKEEESTSQDAWSVYMKEVRKYKEACCDDDSKTRPLVK